MAKPQLFDLETGEWRDMTQGEMSYWKVRETAGPGHLRLVSTVRLKGREELQRYLEEF